MESQNNIIHMSFIQQACLDAKNIDEVYIYCSDDAVKPYVLPGVK